MIIAYDNKYASANVNATNENPVYTIANSQDTRLSRLFKSTGVSSVITISFAQAEKITSCFIANHNFGTGVTITIKGNDTADFTTPAYSSTISYGAYICFKLFTEQDFQYWQIGITNANEFQFGHIHLGSYLSLTNTFSHVLAENIIDTTQVFTSLSGQTYTNVGYEYRSYELNFPRITGTDRAAIKTMQTATRKRPMYFLLADSVITEFTPLYATVEDVSYSRVYNDFYTISMNLKESK